jgi:hypothetical protein
VENITHSLLGAALAEVALPKDATPRQRTLFYASGIIAGIRIRSPASWFWRP